MENPSSHGKAEHVVSDAIKRHDQVMAESPGLCGLSLTRTITDALRKEGLLLEDGIEEQTEEYGIRTPSHHRTVWYPTRSMAEEAIPFYGGKLRKRVKIKTKEVDV